MRNSWTDERLDDGFNHVGAEIQAVRNEVKSVKHDVQSLRGEVHDGFSQMNARLDGLQRIFMQLCGGVIVALIGLIATQL